MILAAGLVAGCTKVGSDQPHESDARAQRHAYTVPHTLRFASGEDIVGLNPHLVTQLSLSYMSSLTMAWLVKSGPDGKPTPELLTEIPSIANHGISADGKTIVWHLRRGVTWSDGAPFNADDVVFSIKTVLNPATNEVSRDGWDLITKVDEPDLYTVQVHLRKKYSPHVVTFFSSFGANPCVLPKHLLGQLPNINNAAYNALPIGIGPFKYDSWKRGDSIEMSANPRYFRGLPKIRKVVFKIIPDRNTLATQLQTHEIDLWTQVTANFIGRLRRIDGVAVVSYPSYLFDHLDFNLSHAVVADPIVRQALRYATDREALRQKVRHGFGIVSDNIFGPSHPAYHPIPVTPFRIDKANQLLDGDGWKRGPDGIRVKNGTRLYLNLATSAGTPDNDTEIELIRASWKQVGVGFDVHHYDSALFFALAQNGGVIYGGRFDAIIFAWKLDALGSLTTLYGCDSVPPNGQNDSHWCDRASTRAMTDFDREYDERKRLTYDYFVTDRLAKDVPLIVLDVRDEAYASNTDLKNWHPNNVNLFDNFMDADM